MEAGSITAQQQKLVRSNAALELSVHQGQGRMLRVSMLSASARIPRFLDMEVPRRTGLIHNLRDARFLNARSKANRGTNSEQCGRRFKVSASLPVQPATTVQISASLFTFATALVIPLYTIMILAPRKTWTKQVMQSNIPHVILGALYTYLLSISWTPDTLRFMFASKNYLPELAGMTQMFSSTLTVASAWVHLLAADLFVGRQIFLEGLEQDIETRHSLVLCLMFCPVGMLCHIFTKTVTSVGRRLQKAQAQEIAVLGNDHSEEL